MEIGEGDGFLGGRETETVHCTIGAGEILLYFGVSDVGPTECKGEMHSVKAQLYQSSTMCLDIQCS